MSRPARPDPEPMPTWHQRLRALAGCGLLALPSLALACGPYAVAFYEFGPLYYRDASGQPAGIDKDLIDELAQRSGCIFSSQLESRARIWEHLARGQLDITVSGIETPERARLAEFVPYLRTRNVVLMRKALARQIGSPEAFLAEPKLSVVVVKQFSHGPRFDTWLAELRRLRRVHDAADFESALRVFRAGRVDLMLSHPFTLPRDPEWLNEIEALDWAPHDQLQPALVLARDRVLPPDRERLRAALQSLLKDGTVDAILARHLSSKAARSVRLGNGEPPP